MSRISDHLFLLLQMLLPKHLLTALVHWLARIRVRVVKNFLIERFVRHFRVDIDEVCGSIPDDFADFNAFFTRELNAGARPLDESGDSIVSPVDGTVSACGVVSAGTILQAKGINYGLDDLLATDLDSASRFHDGRFATIYLAPHDYHRIHMPVAGTLKSAVYVPGDLYSVNAATVRLLPNLFTRNERLVCNFATEFGGMALIMIGALNVGSIGTPWSGEIRPQKSGVASVIDLGRKGIAAQVDKGDLIGWFNMGSTVILLFPHGASSWEEQFVSGKSVRMGEAIGSLRMSQ